MSQDEQLLKANELALKILNLSRNSLLVNLRFLENALTRFRFQTYSDSVGTDGANIYYNPLHILKRYRLGEKIPSHDYLHMVLHCIYRHNFVGAEIDREIWNISCDIAVENQIAELNLGTIDNPYVTEKKILIEMLHNKVKFISAEHIYAYFKKNPSEISAFRKHFITDDHSMWYNFADTAAYGSGESDESEADNDESDDAESNQNEIGVSENSDNSKAENDESVDSESSKTDSSEKKVIEESFNYSAAMSRLELKKQLEQQWKDISERIQSELENFCKEQGYASGNFIQSLKEINRERYDYTEFLKKFAVTGEVMKIDMDEFDYNYYSYGLQLYGNVALIEPLEYKDVKRIREFVIAIDTSGSVSGSLVQGFITKTYNILKNTDSFFSKVNIWIIQCDSTIQEAVQITSQEEFDKYIKKMELKGFGGTDFRPVFKYVDNMLKKRLLTNLKGMIYFTDGYGTFPKYKPKYETAFAFLRNDYERYGIPDVPVWAIKLILEEDDIIQNSR